MSLTETLQSTITADRTRGLALNGEIEIYTLSPQGMTIAQKQGGLPSTWDLLVPGSYAEFGEHTDLLFYDRTSGTGTFLTTDMAGALQLLQWHKGWRTSWYQILSGHFLENQPGGNNSLLFYDRTAGHGEFYRVDGKGGISLAAKHTNWHKTWSLIVPGYFLKSAGGFGYNSLLFYDRAAGHGEFFATDGKGGISLVAKHTDWRKSWNIILKRGASSPNSLLFYDRAAGHGEFYAVDGNGNLSLTAKHTDWSKSWDVILQCWISQDIHDGLLFYDRTAGIGEFYAVDGNGNLSLVARHTDWRHTWYAIASGGFVGVGEPSLLFYQR